MDLDRLKGLRGCGGAGFPADFKWKAVRDEPVGDEGKIIVCNADEGEPGTFKDGWLLEERAEEVIRGMLLAASFCDSDRGYIYLRPEYQRQKRALVAAIEKMVEAGQLSAGSGAVWYGAGFAGRPVVEDDHGLDDIALAALDWHVEHGAHGLLGEETDHGGVATLGKPAADRPLPPRARPEITPAADSGVSFRLDLCMGGGAYICGEETALLESMEGRRPQPRHKPPFPTQSGLWGLPTLMNNVETFWWADRLLNRGGDAPGGDRRLYSLSGDVERPGVYEAAVGITARELIDLHGGGVRDGAEVSCWIPGGAATGVLPGSLLDTPLSQDGLKEVGTALGTAAVVVYAAPTDPREIAAKIMRFFSQESCSQCTPCRLGCRAFAGWLDGSEPWPAAERTADWLEAMELGSICGLGFTAPLIVKQLDRWFAGATA
jgi:formate dehydrogenase